MKPVILAVLLLGGIGSPVPERTVFREAPIIVIEKTTVPELVPISFTDVKPLTDVFKQDTVVPRATIPGNDYDAGNCTFFAKSQRPDLPNHLGNAAEWISSAVAEGIPEGSVPKVNAIAVSTSGAYGHVAIVRAVRGDTIDVEEMNWSGLGVVTQRTTSTSEWSGFLY